MSAMSIKQRAALISIAVTIAITLAKGITGWLSGSLALMSDAMQSLLDVAATTATFLAVRIADKPADEEHPYGHGKFESLAALGQTILLCMLAGIVAFEGIRRLDTGETSIEATPITFIVLIVSILVDASRWWFLRKTAAETGSQALAADALHFSSDLVNSILVILALLAARLGYPQVDPLVAIGVAVFIAIAGYNLGRQTIDTLIDTAPKELTARVRKLVADIPGVVEVESVRLRPAGGQVLGEIEIKVGRMLPLERVVAIKAQVSRALESNQKGCAITVTANPQALDNETVLERVLLIAAKRRVPVHHITTQQVEGRLSIGLDMEVDGRMTLGAAHTIANKLEAALRGEFGPETEIDTHIEPLNAQELEGHPLDDDTHRAIAEKLTSFAAATGVISDVHQVRARETQAGWFVHFHCRADPKLAIGEVHRIVDEIERQLRGAFTAIDRVVGHAEPPRAPRSANIKLD